MHDSRLDIHPAHSMPAEVVAGLQDHREGRWRDTEEEFELLQASRPTPEEREFTAQLATATLRSSGIDAEEFHATRTRLRERQFDRLSKASGATPHDMLDLIPVDLHAAAPAAADPSFWYARANWFGDSPFTGSFAADGLSFRGMKNHNSGNLIKLRFGYTAAFELHANRVPHSPSGRWRSAPHIEIFGRLIGSSQDSFGFGDDWCKCWMSRRQTAFQFVFAPPGASNRRIIGERIEHQTIFFSEDAPFTGFWRGPGFQPMPELVLTHPFPAQSIWVELELRFDIQLEGSAQLWIDPHQRFLVRGFQWPARPF